MLQSIRDRSQGLIVGVIVFLISLTFALWGIQSYVDAGGQVVVAEAAGEEILLSEFQDSLQRFRQQAQSVLGESFDPDAWDQPQIRQQALDELVDERLLLEALDDGRVRVSDAQVTRQLQQIPSFQDENGFSREIYQQRVPLLGLSQAGFEQKLRQDMATAQLRAGIAASEFVTDAEVAEVERLRKQTRDIGYAIIPGSNFDGQISPTDADIDAHFLANQEQWRSEERVKLESLEISAEALGAEIVVTDEALQNEYDTNQATYTVAEERNVNHILIQVPRSADVGTEAAAMVRAATALARAREGESFETLAKEVSDDVGSSTEGGETGFFPRGIMAPEFEEAAFALAVGEVSEPVRTQFGLHIIKLKAIKAGGLTPFDEARDDVEAAYRLAEAQKLLFERASDFSNLVYENPDSLAVAADALNLEIKATESLTRGEIADEYSEKLAAAVFDAEVLLQGLNAEPVELPDGRIVAVRVLAHEPSTIPPLADVRHQVEQAVREARQRDRAKLAAEEMVGALRTGESETELAKAQGLGWETADGVGRDSDAVNRAVLRAAFKLAVTDDSAAYTSLPIGKSDYAVIRAANVVMPAVEALEKSDLNAVENELLQARSQTTWREFVRALRETGDVKIYAEKL